MTVDLLASAVGRSLFAFVLLPRRTGGDLRALGFFGLAPFLTA
jgi:hypothetical protein